MTKPARHNGSKRKAAPALGAAFALSFLLVVGLVPFEALGLAKPSAAGDSASSGEGTPVVAQAQDDAASKSDGASVETQQPDASSPNADSAAETAADPTPTPTPAPAPESADPEPSNEAPMPDDAAAQRTWLIGLDQPDAVTAELWPDGTFVVYGSGAALSFEQVEKPDGSKTVTVPWLVDGYARDIKRVVFANAVQPESLAYWFDGCENLQSASAVPASVEDMTCAFRGCSKLEEAPALPDGLVTLASAFEGCEALTQLPALPLSVTTFDRAFFDCPGITELPAAFAFPKSCASSFGFSRLPEKPLAMRYEGVDEAVLSYDWEADGRVLEAPAPPDADNQEPAADAEEPEEEQDVAPIPEEATDEPNQDGAAADKDVEDSASQAAKSAEALPEPAQAVSEPATSEPAAQQVSITVPSSVPLLLSPQDGQNSAQIPVSVANRSQAAVRIVGVRLKRTSVDLPGGSWSLVLQDTGTSFVDEARFTPSGKEAVLTTPVELAPDSAERLFVWEGTFSNFEMKNLLQAAADAQGSFTYGTMIWHIEAV